MKNLLIVISFVFMSISQLAANTGSNSTSLDVLKSEKSVILDLEGLVADVKSFTITDYKGVNVFSEKVDKYQNRVKYDLSKLPTGRYTIKVEGENFVELHTALITNELVSIESLESHFRPTFKEINEKIMVDATFTNVENIQVAIYSANGELVYEFRDQENGRFQKVFNLEQLEKGKYNVVVSTDHFSRSSTISR